MGSPANDLIIRLKNGYMANRQVVSSPYSKFRVEILSRLKEKGYIKGYDAKVGAREITINLAYEDGVPGMTDAKLYSKPGRRLYARSGKASGSKTSLGDTFLSTSKGILTGVEAKKQKIGGELLFSVW